MTIIFQNEHNLVNDGSPNTDKKSNENRFKTWYKLQKTKKSDQK